MNEFPFTIPSDWANDIDSAVKGFQIATKSFWDALTHGITVLVSAVNNLLDITPWWLLVAVVFVLGWRSSKRIRSGLIYAAALMIVGVLGLWNYMNMTLAIVITSVIIAIILGFPIGILASENERMSAIIRPILDTMQTMPIMTYLIPMVIFFKLGKAPAVVATVIYAVVPVIRMTDLGIRQVDKEVIEAARAFGSTGIQSLVKVQIPQAFPTIMAGINQTLMMAMAMVTMASMVGAPGLGLEVLTSVNRLEIGRGLFAGASVVIIAVILDRLTQNWYKKDGGDDSQ